MLLKAAEDAVEEFPNLRGSRVQSVQDGAGTLLGPGDKSRRHDTKLLRATSHQVENTGLCGTVHELPDIREAILHFVFAGGHAVAAGVGDVLGILPVGVTYLLKQISQTAWHVKRDIAAGSDLAVFGSFPEVTSLEAAPPSAPTILAFLAFVPATDRAVRDGIETTNG